jgi:hypothetical protein
MMPFLDKSVAASSRTALSVPPPTFRGLHGPFVIHRYEPSPYVRGSGTTSAHKIGLRYEAQVQDWLNSNFRPYDAAPTIRFTEHIDQVVRQRTAIPDGVLVRPDHVVVFEIKYTHCPEAWWQTEKLYAPLLREYFRRKRVSCVEICRAYDSAVSFPCPVTLIDDLKEWVQAYTPDFGVFQWRKAD